MLGKLLKYELKSTARLFLLMYAALLVVTIINMFIQPWGNGIDYSITTSSVSAVSVHTTGASTIRDFLSSIGIFLYMILVIAVFVMTIVIVVIRFYRMLGDEGYLWFTLPVTANQHVLGKLIVSLLWFVASCLVVCLSVVLLFLPSGSLEACSYGWSLMVTYGYDPGNWLLCSIVVSLISWLATVLTFYAAIAIGPNIIKSRLGGSVVVYIAIYFVLQIVSTLGVFLIIALLQGQIEMLMPGDNPLAMMVMPTTVAAVNQIVLVSSLTLCVGEVVLAVILYVLTRYFLTRKLNLA